MLLAPMLLATPHARAVLRIELTQAVAGRSFLAAVEVQTDPHWHVYWRNPGDSGIPTTLAWRAPKGWRVEPLEYPVPKRFAPGGIAAYGYEGKTLFLARVTPSKTPGNLSATAKWLVCAEACVAGGANPSAKVAIGAQAVASSQAAALKAAQAALPRPSGTWTYRAVQGGKGVQLVAMPPRGALPKGLPTFFPLESGVIDHAKPGIATLQGRSYVIQMSASPFPESRARLKGLLVAPKDTRWPGGISALLVDARLESGE